MKKFSSYINLTHWQTIKDRYAHVIDNIGSRRSEHLEDSELPYLEKLLSEDLTNFSGRKHIIRNAMFFYSNPKESRGLHIDYFNNWHNYPTWALNIPIVNGDQCEMQWYGGEYTKEVKTVNNGSIAWHLTWKSTPVLLESEIIDKPTLVYVDIPHDVINHSSQPRIVLSLRFAPSPIQKYK
jgi:hypothetical protein